MAKEPETIDLAKAAEKLAEAQEGVKLAHAAYQSCTRAWDGIRGPSDAKRAMWKAIEAARGALVYAMKTEARHFGVMQSVVGQGDLFNDGVQGEESGGGEPEPGGQGPVGGPGTAIAHRPRRKGRGGEAAAAN